MKLISFALILMIVSGCARPARGDLPKLFDPARHMRVDEVREGMKGYGLSVFKGTKIERFDVEVVSVMHNFNPKRDVVLIRASGQNLEHTGGIAGMSGSPVFLRDDQGKDRMIGAFAYGWGFAKDPIAGVQPIEYMLEMGQERDTRTSGDARAELPGRAQSWNVLHGTQQAMKRLQAASGAGPQSALQNPQSLRPLATPVATSGAPAHLIQKYAPAFASQNLTLLSSGAAGKSNVDAKIEPGSVVVTPLLTGDLEFHANGTCTEVIGDRVFAFGHPFNNEGDVTLPLAAGEVNAVIASLESSFKIAAVGAVKGTVHTDRMAGIAGTLGPAPGMIPIDLTVVRPDGRTTRFHFDSIRHPRLLAPLAAVAIDSALVGDAMLPQYNTVRYELTMEFDNGLSLRIDNADVNVATEGLLTQLITPIAAAAENPFQRVLPKRITGTLKVSDQSSEAAILAVQIPKTKFRPGDTISGFVTYRPFRGEEADLPFSLQLPRDLPDGQYQLVVGDWTRYFTDETTAKPFRFSAETIGEVFDVLQDVLSVRHDELFIRLLRQPDGVAIGRVAMSQLPSSRRQVLLGAGRSNVTAFVSSDVKRLKTDLLITGSADFTIQIETQTKVEAGKTATTRPAG